MSTFVEISTRRIDCGADMLLLLIAEDGTKRAWSKRYDAQFFLAMDCLGLGLLEIFPPTANSQGVNGGKRARGQGVINLQILERCRFTEL